MTDRLPPPNPDGVWPPDPTSPHAAWIVCDCCEDYLCTIHESEHAFECDCPAIEEWACDPYSAGGRPVSRHDSIEE